MDVTAFAGPGLSVLAFDPVAISHSITLTGQAAFESDPISLCVPQDAVGLALYGDLTKAVYFSSYVGSGVGDAVDASSPEALFRFQSPDVFLPKGPEVKLQPGRHTFKLASETAGQVQPALAIRRGTRGATSHYGVNLILVDGCGIDASNIQAFADASTLFDQIYAQVGVVATSVGIGFIHDTSLAVVAQTNEHVLAEATVEPSTQLPLVEQAINFYFVRELTSDDTAGTLLGHAMGIPGAPGFPRKAGVVLSVDAHRNGTALDYGAMWITAAHEGGHWHGLRHTSERWGTMQDLIADTPQCFPEQDLDHDTLVDMVECAGKGAENLMFWTYDFAKPPTVLTQGQGYVLSSALTMNPG